MLETKFCPKCHRPYDASLPECPVCAREAWEAEKKARQEEGSDALRGKKRSGLYQRLTNNKAQPEQDDDQDATVIVHPVPEDEAPAEEAAPLTPEAEQVTDNQALLDEMLPGDPEEAQPEEPKEDAVSPAAGGGQEDRPRKEGRSPAKTAVLAILIVALAAVLCFGGYALLSSGSEDDEAGTSSGTVSAESDSQGEDGSAASKDSQEGSGSNAQGDSTQEGGTSNAQGDSAQEDSGQTEDGGETTDPTASSGDAAEGTADGAAGETGSDQDGDGASAPETTPDASTGDSGETETPDAAEGGDTGTDSGSDADSGNTDGNTTEENSNTDSMNNSNTQPESADTGADSGDTAQTAV
ncbi:MAG: hypothetical protein LIO70_05730 [Clostridiales bacterium]|nr:hypothetical protein [Clostridiales bacterium]